jgi:hypothetical protein
MKNHVCALHGIPPSSRAEVALPHGRLNERLRGGKGHGGRGASVPDGGHVFDGVDNYGGGRLKRERVGSGWAEHRRGSTGEWRGRARARRG